MFDPRPPSRGTAVLRDLILTVYRAVETGAHDLLETSFHPAVTWRRPGEPVIAGLADLMDYYRSRRAALTSSIIVDDVVIEGDRAVAFGMVEGRCRDGAPIHERFADSCRFEDGLIRDRTTYFFRHGF
jgi:ketosteroid isomerase-like protein